MVFIPKKIIYISSRIFYAMLSIFKKQAVWCQCACVLYVVLAIASWSSCQDMTFSVDVFWSVVFTVHSIVIFAAAEHEHIFGIKIVLWQSADNTRLNTIIALQLSNIFDFGIVTRLLFIPLFLFVLTKIPQRYNWIRFMCGIFSLTQGLLNFAVAMSYGYMCYIISSMRQHLPGQNHTNLTNIYKIKALNVILTALILWSLRCAERFPHKFRWYPIMMGIVGILAAVVYCSYCVAKTTTSMNIILGRSTHLVAASLKAAEKCPQCKQVISALDMESRF